MFVLERSAEPQNVAALFSTKFQTLNPRLLVTPLWNITFQHICCSSVHFAWKKCGPPDGDCLADCQWSIIRQTASAKWNSIPKGRLLKSDHQDFDRQSQSGGLTVCQHPHFWRSTKKNCFSFANHSSSPPDGRYLAVHRHGDPPDGNYLTDCLVNRSANRFCHTKALGTG